MRKAFYQSLFFLFAGVSIILSAGAVHYGENMEDPALAKRARHLYTLLRCPVCAGQSLEASQAQLAQEMRRDIRRLLTQGRTDAEIIQHFKKQYGEAVAFEPILSLQNVALWGLPFLMLAVGGLYLARRQRSQERFNHGDRHK